MHFIGVYDYTVVLTYMSLVSAVLGMIQAGKGRFTAAVLCLVACGICDAFDGTVARTKKNRTEDEKSFGIQLDSLCDVVSFGVFPAYLCHCMGVRSVPGVLILCAYCMCAVSRLAFFNVLEAKRQQAETGANKFYRGLPVTTASLILPLVYLVRPVVTPEVFAWVLQVVMAVVAFLFVLDFRMKKPDIGKILGKK